MWNGTRVDVRIVGGRVDAIGAFAEEKADEVIDAGGGLLVPGLHDHHLHLAATAVRRSSVHCGPPSVVNEDGLKQVLSASGSSWLRGVGYDEAIAGMIDRHWLDRVASDRPVRIQDRTGRLWIFNSAGLDRLLAGQPAIPAGLERDASGWTGRLFDEDAWLRETLSGSPPDLAALGADLARFGVTGVTDMTPSNGPAELAWLARQQKTGALPQSVVVAGTPALANAAFARRQTLGAVKIHLHEAHLPDFDATVRAMTAAHDQARAVAVHCVTEVEMVFTLAAFAQAGVIHGDRIEHASVTPDALVRQVVDLGLVIGANPGFVHDRGDAYRRDIPSGDWPMLYRLATFRERGVTMLGSSDAPYGDIDPWIGMRAATDRKTRGGAILGGAEAISADAALELYLADPVEPTRIRKVEAGAPADLCLLRKGWGEARGDLSAGLVAMTIIDGKIAYRAAA
nr:amidohydrolase family protein [Croceicoccus gelatinilyticus]